jgi:hypothetical protein
MSDAALRASGSCLCGAVRFEVRGPLREVVACHCSQCRKMTGHYLAATAARDSDLKVTNASGLKWFSASAGARRGFCGQCGSTLFWHGTDRDYTAIAAGSLDGPTGLALAQHIFTADKADYYRIDDGLPCSERDLGGVTLKWS